jgi:hypothetical protein
MGMSDSNQVGFVRDLDIQGVPRRKKSDTARKMIRRMIEEGTIGASDFYVQRAEATHPGRPATEYWLSPTAVERFRVRTRPTVQALSLIHI